MGQGKFVKIDEKVDEDEVRIKFVLKEELQKEIEEKDSYSMDEFYKKHFPMLKHNEFVVITLDKETNQLLSFLCGRMRKKENNLIKRAMFKQGTSIFRAYYPRCDKVCSTLG